MLAEPFALADTRVRGGASIGIAVALEGDRPHTLLRDADIAMYRAKARKKGGFEFFDAAMRSRLVRELAVGGALEEALERGALEVRYQPIVALPDRRPLAVEALVRWRHPRLGWLTPEEFVPVAEKNGLIVPLGRHVLTEAARQAAAWRERYPQALPLGVFVNVSALELARPSFAEHVERILSEHGLSGEEIAFELTERAFIDDRDRRVTETLTALTELGVRLVLDDFGRVESRARLNHLCALGCDAAQGYHLGSARLPERLAPLLARVGGTAPAAVATAS